MAKKTVVFYGVNAKAARDKHPEIDHDSFQVIQSDAWHGERLEADEYEFMGDVSPAEQERIKSLWGKFDNRQNVEKGGAPTSLAGVERTPASDRRNLNPETRVDDPKNVEADQLEKPGYAPKAEIKQPPGNLNPKPTGLDQTTGKPVAEEELRKR